MYRSDRAERRREDNTAPSGCWTTSAFLWTDLVSRVRTGRPVAAGIGAKDRARSPASRDPILIYGAADRRTGPHALRRYVGRIQCKGSESGGTGHRTDQHRLAA